jgi:hypothetical protein
MSMNSKRVPLTAKVVRGLAAMKAACSASPIEVLLGLDGDHPLNKEEAATMDDYESAVRWINDQQAQRERSATHAR